MSIIWAISGGKRWGRALIGGVVACAAAGTLIASAQAQGGAQQGGVQANGATPTPAPPRLPRPDVIAEPDSMPIGIGLPIARGSRPAAPVSGQLPGQVQPVAPVAGGQPRPQAVPQAERPVPLTTPAPNATPVEPVSPSPSGQALATPSPLAAETSPAPEPVAAGEAGSTAPDLLAIVSSVPVWLIAAFGVGLLAAVIVTLVLVLMRRRRRRPDRSIYLHASAPAAAAAEPPEPAERPGTTPAPPEPAPATEPEPEPNPAPPSPEPKMLRRDAPPVEPVPAPLIVPSAAQRPWIDIGFKALRAGRDEINAIVDFELEIHNRGSAMARNVRIIAQLLTAGPHQNHQLEAIFASGPTTPLIDPPAIEVGGHAYIRASGSIVVDRINRLELTGRPMFVPILAARVFYDWDGGQDAVSANGFILGVDRGGTDKMLPFWLDTPAKMHDNIGWRLHDIGVRR